MDAAADDVAGGFVEVIVEEFREFEELWPECLIDHRLGAADHDCRVALAALAERLQMIPAAEGDEELTLPWVWQAEFPVEDFFRSCAELGVESVQRAAGCLFFAWGIGAAKKGLDLTDFFDELVPRHEMRSGGIDFTGRTRGSNALLEVLVVKLERVVPVPSRGSFGRLRDPVPCWKCCINRLRLIEPEGGGFSSQLGGMFRGPANEVERFCWNRAISFLRRESPRCLHSVRWWPFPPGLRRNLPGRILERSF